MCIVLLNLSHPDFLFICGANRDEVLARPAAASHWHNFPSPSEYSTHDSPSPSLAFRRGQSTSAIDHDGTSTGIGQDGAGPSAKRFVLSGLDVHPSGGGTWIGITADGRFGALTNYTEFERPPLPQGRGLTDFRSRGTLVKDWLVKPRDGPLEEGLEKYLDDIDGRSDEWPGFNVLAGYLLDEQGHFEPRIGYVTNREEKQTGKQYLWPSGGSTSQAVCVTDDVKTDSTKASLGLSNSTYLTPWSKVKTGQEALDEALLQYDERKKMHGQDLAEKRLAEDIFDILATPTGVIKAREDLRQTVLVTPLKMPSGLWYATRVATVLLVRRPMPRKNDLGQSKARSTQGHESGAHAQWWERDICLLDKEGQVPVRCGPDHQRHYSFALHDATTSNNE